MNYIKLINWFWDEVPHTNGYRPLYGLLFLGIVDGINRNGWRQNTVMDYERIINKCKFTKEVYLAGRKWLMENQFIEFVPGKNNMQMACFSLGAAVGKLTGIPTGTLADEWEENLPATLPVSLPNNKHKTKNTLKDKQKTIYAIDLNIPFKDFYDLYDKKMGKEKSEKLWLKLTDEEREIAMDHLPNYKLSQPEKKYRKDPATYIFQKAFNDEIINTNASTTNNRQTKFASKQASTSNQLDRLYNAIT